jgi:hypothetical protein
LKNFWKNVEGSSMAYLKGLSQYVSQGTEGNHDNLSLLAKTRTVDVANMKQEC